MVKILALGDSYTAGANVAYKDRFIDQLAVMLAKHGIPDVTTKIIAKGGWKAETLKGALDQAIPGLNVIDPEHGKTTYDYDMVTLLIGVNDLTVGNPRDTFAEQFDVLLRRSVVLAGNRPGRVLVLSLPAYGHTPDAHHPKTLKARSGCAMVKMHIKGVPGYNTPEGIKATVERYNQTIEETVEKFNNRFKVKKKIRVIDIYSITKNLPSKKHPSGSEMHLPEHFDKPGVHYKREMYTRWAEALLPHALEMLKPQPHRQSATVH